jgi:3-hydroxyacyl-CoA dehydrogenase
MGDSYDVSIVGAGAMGHGLAVQCAVTDQHVTLVDHRQRNLDRARDQIEEAVAFLHARNLTDRDPGEVAGRVDFTLQTSDGVGSADIVLETITEDLATKRELFSEVARAAPPDAVLASNTSSLPITEIANGVPGHADRIAGCHWWYPPYLLTPVEVIRGEETSQGTVDSLCAFVEAVGRDPVLVERDVPGFVWNRVQFAVVRECLHIVEEGVASVEDVNRAIRDGYATRTAAIGPFETIDIAGMDLFATIAADLYPELANDDEPQETLRERIRDGRTGIDAGSGFFEYDVDPKAVTRRRDETIAAIRQAIDEAPD